MRKICDFFFDEIVFVPIMLHEVFHKDSTYDGDASAIANRYDVIQLAFFYNVTLTLGVILGMCVRANKLNLKDSELNYICGWFLAGVIYLLSHFLVKKLKKKRYVQGLMDIYFSYSDGYKSSMSFIWYVKYFLLFLPPIIMLLIFTIVQDKL